MNNTVESPSRTFNSVIEIGNLSLGNALIETIVVILSQTVKNISSALRFIVKGASGDALISLKRRVGCYEY